MTETEWLTSNDSESMLTSLWDFDPSSRGLQLFACACCRRIEHLSTADWFRNGIDVAERYADGKASKAELESCQEQAGRAADEAEDVDLPHFEKLARLGVSNALAFALDGDAMTTLEWTAYGLTGSTPLDDPVEEAKRVAVFDAESRAQADLLRDIFGNPFRPIVCDFSWRAPAVIDLANRIYDERRFERLPDLADELVKAGCSDETVLGHCRAARGHALGCWVVDMLLGKE